MLKEYTLSDLLSIFPTDIAYYANRIETMKKPDMEWPHRQAFYSIIWFTHGEGSQLIDFIEYQIVPGRIFLINPEQINNGAYSRNSKGYMLLFSKSLASQLNIEFRKPCLDIKNCETLLLQLVFKKLIKDYRSNNHDFQYKNMASIQYFYSLVSDKMNDKVFSLDKTNNIFRQFKELILKNDFKIQSMNIYADTLHISTVVLNTICQNFAGTSAKQLFLDLKITEAKRLLIYSNLNINEISFQLGFEDSSYFARIFKKKTLLSPTSFQGKCRK